MIASVSLPYLAMTDRTLFHKIRDHEIPSTIVFENDDVLAFKDIHPKAPTHVLFIAKKDADFVPSIADITDASAHVPLLLIRAAQQFAKEKDIDGYQLRFHVGRGGGQEVFYLHLHFLSEQTLS